MTLQADNTFSSQFQIYYFKYQLFTCVMTCPKQGQIIRLDQIRFISPLGEICLHRLYITRKTFTHHIGQTDNKQQDNWKQEPSIGQIILAGPVIQDLNGCLFAVCHSAKVSVQGHIAFQFASLQSSSVCEYIMECIWFSFCITIIIISGYCSNSALCALLVFSTGSGELICRILCAGH